MMSRLGVLGGMFDPVHLGHVNAARYVLETLNLDSIKLVPCYQPNHRQEARESATHRIRMLELAIAAFPQLEVDDCEIERGGVSYAVDTLAHLGNHAAARQLVFILGIDSFNTLLRWHKWESLLALCHLFVLSRESEGVNPEVANSLGLKERQVSEPQDLFDSSSGKIFLDQEFVFDSSSSRVRRKIESGDSLENLLDHSVIEYIYQNELYGSSVNRMQNATI